MTGQAGQAARYAYRARQSGNVILESRPLTDEERGDKTYTTPNPLGGRKVRRAGLKVARCFRRRGAKSWRWGAEGRVMPDSRLPDRYANSPRQGLRTPAQVAALGVAVQQRRVG